MRNGIVALLLRLVVGALNPIEARLLRRERRVLLVHLGRPIEVSWSRIAVLFMKRVVL
jgi:hypothetical protein